MQNVFGVLISKETSDGRWNNELGFFLKKKTGNEIKQSQLFPHNNSNSSLVWYSGVWLEELDGRAVSALGVRSWKLSTGLNGQS
jgi:hypothetical protein